MHPTTYLRGALSKRESVHLDTKIISVLFNHEGYENMPPSQHTYMHSLLKKNYEERLFFNYSLKFSKQ